MGGQVSILEDIYIYGILLLKMCSGKRPIDEMFKNSLSSHKFAAIALLKNVMYIVDQSMFFEDDIQERTISKEEDPQVNVSSGIKDCLVSLLWIGLSCSTTSPNKQMPTNIVVNELNAIRDTFLKSKEYERRMR